MRTCLQESWKSHESVKLEIGDEVEEIERCEGQQVHLKQRTASTRTCSQYEHSQIVDGSCDFSCAFNLRRFSVAVCCVEPTSTSHHWSNSTCAAYDILRV